jgi:hypothetical protein
MSHTPWMPSRLCPGTPLPTPWQLQTLPGLSDLWTTVCRRRRILSQLVDKLQFKLFQSRRTWINLFVFLLCLPCRDRSACLWSRRTRFRWCRCCHTLLWWTVRRYSDRCTWSLCSLRLANGNGVHGLFSLHGHHWDLVTILPRLLLYSTRIHCLSRCRRLRWHVSPFYSHRVHGAQVRLRSLALSLPSLALHSGVLGFFDSSRDVPFLLLCSSPLLNSLNVWISRHFGSWGSILRRVNIFRVYLVDLIVPDRLPPQTSGSVEISWSYAHKTAAGTQFSRHSFPTRLAGLEGPTGFLRMFTVTGLLYLHDGIIFVSLCLFVQKL